MKIIALHNLEEVAELLANLSSITEVSTLSVATLEKFQNYLNKYKFNAVIIFEKFFKEAINILLSNPKYPKTVNILVKEGEDISKFLRLGIIEANIDTIPFNPLMFFVKLRSLITLNNQIEQLIKQGLIEFDFYRYGLFNVLNVLSATDKNLFLAVKDIDEDKVLYSLRVRNGQVVSASIDLEEIIEINTDDSIPKLIVYEPTKHEDKVIFKNTAEFYGKLLDYSSEEKTEEVIPKKSQIEPKKAGNLEVNFIRKRKVYSFPYKGYEIYTQPFENAQNLDNAVFVLAQLDVNILKSLNILLAKNPKIKVLTTPLIKSYLKIQGYKGDIFINFENVKHVEIPFLGNRFESLIYFPEGILITGTLFGSYVSRDLEFFDRILLSHLRVFHYANIGSNEKLKTAMEFVNSIKDKLFYIFPNYGYPVDISNISNVVDVLNDLYLAQDFRSLYEAWEDLAHIFPKKPKNFDDFIRMLKTQDKALLFTLIDEMETLGITPYEL